MFKIKLIIMLIAAVGIAGGFAYVYKLKADNAILKANQIQLETAINEQQEVITQQKESYENILTTNKELSAKLEVLQKDNFINERVSANKLKKIFNYTSHFKNVDLIYKRIFKK